jgi:hypothetical protein
MSYGRSLDPSAFGVRMTRNVARGIQDVEDANDRMTRGEAFRMSKKRMTG